MARTIINAAFAGFALAAVGGLAAPAGAQPRLEQTGDGYSVVHDGAAVLCTGPDPAREGRSATLSGGGEDAVVSYAGPATAAGRRG